MDNSSNGQYRIQLADQCQIDDDTSVYIGMPGVGSSRPFGDILAVNGSCLEFGYDSYFVTCIQGMCCLDVDHYVF